MQKRGVIYEYATLAPLFYATVSTAALRFTLTRSYFHPVIERTVSIADSRSVSAILLESSQYAIRLALITIEDGDAVKAASILQAARR